MSSQMHSMNKIHQHFYQLEVMACKAVEKMKHGRVHGVQWLIFWRVGTSHINPFWQMGRYNLCMYGIQVILVYV